ncbi:hypothetical protein N0V82_008742 [Gnomoniopsis sp. IMI 355080]|nr:hypothetical protein N0V82_008742 [Gnomoniopsis sp. IMI 355080]
MQDRRVIYDSEEEDEGFSPPNSPAKGAPSLMVMTAEDENEGQSLGDRIGDTRSTDPDLFRRIYEEQQQGVTDSVPNSMRDTQAQNGFLDKLKSPHSKATDSLSSVTDPTSKSGKKKVLGSFDAKEFGNVTQVTTPSAPGTKQKDVYDFSLSDEEGAPVEPAILHKKVSSKGSRKAGKRKRGQSSDALFASATARDSPPQLSTFDQLAQDQEGESPRPTTKRRKSAQDRHLHQVPDDVDLLVSSPPNNMSDPSGETTMHADGLDSVVPSTRVTQGASHGHGHPPASFFIAPPDTLTLSQRNEYLRMSDHSELDGEDSQQQQPSLPVPKPTHTEGQRLTRTSDGRSSNVTTSSGRRTQIDGTHPLSSPDELNAPSTARKSRQKRHMSIVNEEEEPAQYDSVKIGYTRETFVPRTNRRRFRAVEDSVTDTQVEADKNRARRMRQKQGEHAEGTQEDPENTVKIGLPGEQYAPSPSRRGSTVMAEEDERMQHAGGSMPDTCPPGNASYEGSADVEPEPPSLNRQEPDQAIEAMAGVDPEVWAALPDEIRQELISQQESARHSQTSRTRRSGRGSEAASSLALVQEEPPQHKKRGRKKKVKAAEDDSQAFNEPTTAIEEPEARPSPAATATTKRKRGRPRKVEMAPPSPSSEAEEPGRSTEAPELPFVPDVELSATHGLPHEHPKETSAPKPPAKRGRKKKVVEAPPVRLNELQENAYPDADCDGLDEIAGRQAVKPPQSSAIPPSASVEIEDRQALRDISSTASNTLPKKDSASDQAAEKTSMEAVEQRQEVTTEPKAKETSKSASTPGQQGKVPLRVGLSKKSRIAPLLKVIRK